MTPVHRPAQNLQACVWLSCQGSKADGGKTTSIICATKCCLTPISKGVRLQVIAHLEPLQQRYSAIMEDEGYLDTVLAQGAGRHFKLLCKAVDELFSSVTSLLEPSTGAVSEI